MNPARRFARRLALAASSMLFAATISQGANCSVSVGPGNAFSPATCNINVGDTVTWTLLGGLHNVSADDGSFRSGAVSGSWGPFQFTFTSAGSYPYHCELHGGAGGLGMSGVVNVAGGGGIAGALQFSAGTFSVSEGAGSRTISVTRTGGDDGAVSVAYATSNGTASAGSDYQATSGTLNWADNDDNTKSFTVTILNDGVDEPNETVTLTLSSPGGGATLGSPSVATLTINDDDAPAGGPGTISLTAGSATVSESAANVSLTAQRTGGSTGAVSINYATADGSAGAGSDYQTTNGALAWADGESGGKSIVVPIVGDSVQEPAETFSLALSAPSGGATLGAPSSATVTINDDDLDIPPCVPDAQTLCLDAGSNDRFRVRMTWTDFQAGTGPGFAVPFTSDSGFFYFFGPQNLEVLVKMVNGCGSFSNYYWFYYAAASNVQIDIELADTEADVIATYHNPLGTFASDGDITALQTCP